LGEFFFQHIFCISKFRADNRNFGSIFYCLDASKEVSAPGNKNRMAGGACFVDHAPSEMTLGILGLFR